MPGSISNLGPGFDALSVAVSVYLRAAHRRRSGRPRRPPRPGSLPASAPTRRKPHRFRPSARRAPIRHPAPGPARRRVQSDIPMRPVSAAARRPLSPACASTRRSPPPRRQRTWLALATELEGHPDNAAAALLGGMTLSCQRDDGRIIARSWRWPADDPVRRRDAGGGAARPRTRGTCCRPTCRCATPSSISSARCCSCARSNRAATRICARRCRTAGISRRARRSSRASPSAGPRRSGGPRRLPQRRRPVDRALFTDGARGRGGACSGRSIERLRLPYTIRIWRRIRACRTVRPRLRDPRNLRHMNFTLRCHLCHDRLPCQALWVCDKCLGPLEVDFDYAAIAHDALARADREPAEEPLALSRAAADRGRAAHRPALGLHAARPRRPAGRNAWASASSTSRTTRSTIRPVPTRIASSRSPRRGPSSSASRCSPAPRPATSPAASPSHAARLGLSCCVFIPDDLEAGKVAGAAVYRPAHHRRRAATTTT